MSEKNQLKKVNIVTDALLVANRNNPISNELIKKSGHYSAVSFSPVIEIPNFTKEITV